HGSLPGCKPYFVIHRPLAETSAVLGVGDRRSVRGILPASSPHALPKGSCFMTKGKLTGLVTSLVLTLASVLPARAEEPTTKTYLVLVGVSQYGDKQIKPRPHAEDDAKALYDVFTNKDYRGVDPANVHLLLGNADPGRHSQPATHENVVQALH